MLDLALLSRPQLPGHVTVVGESPSSNKGSSSWPWIVKDASAVKGDVGDGDKLLSLKDGAMRSKDAADLFAKRKYGAVKDSGSRGWLRVLGNPEINLGDAIEIKGAPKAELNGLFKVLSVRHVLSKSTGFVTVVDFSGQVGAKQADALLGGLAGKLGGALGL